MIHCISDNLNCQVYKFKAILTLIGFFYFYAAII